MQGVCVFVLKGSAVGGIDTGFGGDGSGSRARVRPKG